MEKDVEKVAECFTKRDNSVIKSERKPIQSMRLPSFNIPLKKPLSAVFRSKQMKKISVELFYLAKPVTSGYKSFYQAAFDTYRCCQQQGLHLLNLKKIYEEKCHPLKKAKRWKLQETTVARSCLSQMSLVQKDGQTDPKKHQIKKISGKSSPAQQS